MPKVDPRATPQGDEAHQSNLLAQKRIRDTVKSLGWNLTQQQIGGKLKDRGGRRMTLTTFVGPLTLYVDFLVAMNADSSGGTLSIRNGPHNGPLCIQYGHYINVPNNPDSGESDLLPEEILAIGEVFMKHFDGDGYQKDFVSVGVNHTTPLDMALSWFERRQAQWVESLKGMLNQYLNHTWDLVYKLEGREIFRRSFPSKVELDRATDIEVVVEKVGGRTT